MPPIDPSIALGFKQPQIQDPVAATMRAQEVGVNALKMGEMQRGIASQNKLRELYSQGVDVSTPEGFKQLAAVDPSAAMKLRNDALQAQKLQGDIKETGLKITAKEMDIAREGYKNLDFNPSDNNFKSFLEDAVLSGKMTATQAQQQFAEIAPLNVAQRREFIKNRALKAEQLYNDITQRRGQDLGRIPVGYRQTDTGAIEPIPGGPTTTTLSPKEIQAREAKFPQANLAVKSFESKSDTVLKDIERLRNHPGLSSITGLVYGRTPSVTAQGREAQALYDKIVAGLQFKELQDMRNASPTGGALGNVSNQEGTQLRQAAGALDRTQEAGSVQKELDRISDSIRGSKSRVREAFDLTYEYKPSATGGATPSAAPSAAPTGGKKDDPLGIR